MSLNQIAGCLMLAILSIGFLSFMYHALKLRVKEIIGILVITAILIAWVTGATILIWG